MILNQKQVNEFKKYFSNKPRDLIIQVLNSDILNLIDTIEDFNKNKKLPEFNTIEFWTMPLKFVYKMPNKLLYCTIVKINGIYCLPNIDYYIKNNYIIFNNLKHCKSSYFIQIIYE